MNKSHTHSQTIAYVLWIVGFTGAHRFYYGRPITGIIWLLTGGLFLIGWILDLFLIPHMNRKVEHKYYHGHYDYNVAWLLQTFLGLFGIHRFYLSKPWTGILWLVTGGIFGLGYAYDYCTLNQQVNDSNLAKNSP